MTVSQSDTNLQISDNHRGGKGNYMGSSVHRPAPFIDPHHLFYAVFVITFRLNLTLINNNGNNASAAGQSITGVLCCRLSID